MSSYEAKIEEFARGKVLLRLSKPLRDRADVACDACGSSQPRMLYPFKDAQTERYFFVGRNCLQELTKKGVVLRRYGKENGQHAYEQEMELRRHDLENECGGESSVGSGNGSEVGKLDEAARVLESSNGLDVMPIVIIAQSPEHYEVLIPNVGTALGGGSARYTILKRHDNAIEQHGDNGVVVDGIPMELGGVLSAYLLEIIRRLNGDEPRQGQEAPPSDLSEAPSKVFATSGGS